MPLTIDFRKTVRKRAQSDASFRRALLTEAIELLISGDLEIGQSVIRKYINATVGFETLLKAEDVNFSLKAKPQ